MDILSQSGIRGGTDGSSSDNNLDSTDNVKPQHGKDDGNAGKVPAYSMHTAPGDFGKSDDDDDQSIPEVSDTMRKHREMIREMKKNHRVSASILRRVRRRDLHRHQIQQHTLDSFLSDNLTTYSGSFYSDSVYSESIYTAFEQLSVGTPTLSVLIPASPMKSTGGTSLSPTSPSFSLASSPSVSSRFPHTIQESAPSTETHLSWKKESLLPTDSDNFKDDDFSIFSRRNKPPSHHQRKSRRDRKAAGLARVREEVGNDNDDDDGDDFYDSVEVQAENEEANVEEFFDCVPTPEKKSPSRTSDTHLAAIHEDDGEDGGGEALVDRGNSVTRSFPQRSEEEPSKNTIFDPPSFESTKEETRKDILESVSDAQSVDEDVFKDSFQDDSFNVSCSENINQDKNEDFVDARTESPAIDAEKQIRQFAGPSVIEDEEDENDVFLDSFSVEEEDENENFLDSFSDSQSLQQNVERDVFHGDKDQPSFIEMIDEDKIEHFADASMRCQEIDRGEEAMENIASPSIIEKDEENESGDFAESFSGVQSLQRDVEKDLFRNSMENISFIDKIDGDQNENFIDTFSEFHAIDTEEAQTENNLSGASVEDNETNHKDDDSLNGVSESQFTHHLDSSALGKSLMTPSKIEDTNDEAFVDAHSKAQSLKHSVHGTENKALVGMDSSLQQSKQQKAAQEEEEVKGSNDTERINIIDGTQEKPRSPPDQETEHIGNDDELNPISLAEEDKQKIDSILEGFFEEFNSLENDTSANIPETKSVERHSPDLDAVHGTENKALVGMDSALQQSKQQKAAQEEEEVKGSNDTERINIIDGTQEKPRSPPDQETEHIGNDDELNPISLAEEDKQKIDSILEGFFEEFNSLENDTSANIPETKSMERHPTDLNAQLDALSEPNTVEETKCGETKVREVASSEELMIEPIQDFDQNPIEDFDQNPISISMFLQQESNADNSGESDQIENDLPLPTPMKYEQIESDMVVPTPIKNEVKEIDDMLDDFLQSMAAIDEGHVDDDSNCTEDYIPHYPEEIESSALTCNSIEDTPNVSQNSEGIISDCHESCKSTEKSFENVKIKSSLEPDLHTRTKLGVVEIEKTQNTRSESSLTDHDAMDEAFCKIDEPIATSLMDVRILSSDKSPIQTPPPVRDSRLDFPLRAIENEDDFRAIDESQTEQDGKVLSNVLESLIGSETPKGKKILPSCSPLNEQSRSRITSPELNQCLSDSPGIFLFNATASDSKRPNNPVATALSQDSSEEETDSNEKKIQKFSDTADSANIPSGDFNPIVLVKSIANKTSGVINPIAIVKSMSYDSPRPNNLVVTASPRDSARNEMGNIKNIQDISSSSDVVNKLSVVIDPNLPQKSLCDNYARPNNPIAATLSQNSLNEKINVAEKNIQSNVNDDNLANISSEASVPVAMQEATSDVVENSIQSNLDASDLANTSSEASVPVAMQEATSDVVESSIQSNLNASDLANTSSDASSPVAMQEGKCDVAEKIIQSSANASEETWYEASEPVAMQEGKCDVAEKIIQSNGNDSDLDKTSYKASGPVAMQEAVCDNVERPNNPVGVALSKHVLKDEIEISEKKVQRDLHGSDLANASNEASKTTQEATCDVGENNIQSNADASNLANALIEPPVGVAMQEAVCSDLEETWYEASEPVAMQEAVCDNAERPNNPVGVALSTRLLKEEIDSSEKNTRSNANATNLANALSEAPVVAAMQTAICDNSERPSNPVATTLFTDTLQDKASAVGKSIQNVSTKPHSSKSSEGIHLVSPSKTVKGEPTIHEGDQDNASDDGSLPLFDQRSVSTISDSSLHSPKAERIHITARAQRPRQVEVPVPLSHGRDSDKTPCKNNSGRIPRQVPVMKNPPDDAEKSFRSIASPPPIPKKESALTELLGVSASKPPRVPQSQTPPRVPRNETPPRVPRSETPNSSNSNSAKIPFHRTTERASSSERRRSRTRIQRSPHRVETSRSPLFFDRGGEGRSTTGDSSTVSWYTSPARSRTSPARSRSSTTASRQLFHNNRSPPGSSAKKQDRDRSSVGSLPRSSGKSRNSNSKTDAAQRSSHRSDCETTQSTMVTYASPNRSRMSSMKSPLRGYYSLASRPNSPAVSLFSRMPRGARTAIRRMQKQRETKTNNNTADGNGDGEDSGSKTQTPDDLLSVDTVRICTHKFAYKIHPQNGPCDRCWALASEAEREVFRTRGSHLRITKTRSGCQRSCAIFPSEGNGNGHGEGDPVRLCRPCFFATHQPVDGCHRLQLYKGKHRKVRPTR